MIENPWGLQPAEVRAIRAVIQTGTYKLAATLLGKTAQAIYRRMTIAQNRMGATSYLAAVLMFDRWERANQAKSTPCASR